MPPHRTPVKPQSKLRLTRNNHIESGIEGFDGGGAAKRGEQIVEQLEGKGGEVGFGEGAEERREEVLGEGGAGGEGAHVGEEGEEGGDVRRGGV